MRLGLREAIVFHTYEYEAVWAAMGHAHTSSRSIDTLNDASVIATFLQAHLTHPNSGPGSDIASPSIRHQKEMWVVQRTQLIGMLSIAHTAIDRYATSVVIIGMLLCDQVVIDSMQADSKMKVPHALACQIRADWVGARQSREYRDIDRMSLNKKMSLAQYLTGRSNEKALVPVVEELEKSRNDAIHRPGFRITSLDREAVLIKYTEISVELMRCVAVTTAMSVEQLFECVSVVMEKLLALNDITALDQPAANPVLTTSYELNKYLDQLGVPYTVQG